MKVNKEKKIEKCLFTFASNLLNFKSFRLMWAIERIWNPVYERTHPNNVICQRNSALFTHIAANYSLNNIT